MLFYASMRCLTSNCLSSNANLAISTKCKMACSTSKILSAFNLRKIYFMHFCIILFKGCDKAKVTKFRISSTTRISLSDCSNKFRTIFCASLYSDKEIAYQQRRIHGHGRQWLWRFQNTQQFQWICNSQFVYLIFIKWYKT